jgi:hypothetical protein
MSPATQTIAREIDAESSGVLCSLTCVDPIVLHATSAQQQIPSGGRLGVFIVPFQGFHSNGHGNGPKCVVFLMTCLVCLQVDATTLCSATPEVVN